MSVNVSSVKFYVVCCEMGLFHFSQNIAKKGKGVHVNFEEAVVSTYFFLTDSKCGYFEGSLGSQW